MQLQAFERLCSRESRCWGLAQTAESSGKTQSINCNAWDLSNTFWSLSQPTQPWVDPRSKLRQSEARRPGSRKLTFMILTFMPNGWFYTHHHTFIQFHVLTACFHNLLIDMFKRNTLGVCFDLLVSCLCSLIWHYYTVAVRPLSMWRLSSCAFPTVASSSMKLDGKMSSTVQAAWGIFMHFR